MFGAQRGLEGRGAGRIGTILDYGAWVLYGTRGIRSLSQGLVSAIVLVVLLAGGGNFSSASAESSHIKIALIGDSLGANLSKVLRKPSFGGPPDVTWAITAQPGAGWGEGEDAQGNWPLDVVHGGTAAKRVRAAARSRPSAIAIELGTNDALRAAFAVSLKKETQLIGTIAGTDENIDSVVKVATSLSPCVVLVSPSYWPTETYGAEELYTATALQLRLQLLKEASSAPGHTVVVADWSALSATHRVAATSSQNWFSADGLHPNVRGLRAFANLIVRTAKTCAT